MPYTHKQHTEELNRITIQEAASWIGLTLPKVGSARCPFPDHDDKNPSFEIKTVGNRWQCYGACNAYGGTIDFVMKFFSMTFPEAKLWLSEKSGMNLKGISWPKQHKKLPPKINNVEVKINEAAPDTKLYQRFLEHCPLQTDGYHYLKSRGISEKTIDKSRAGQFIGNRENLEPLMVEFEYQRIEASGILSKYSKVEKPSSVFFENCILFPFLEKGKVTYLQARTLAKQPKYRKWINLKNRQKRIYNADVLYSKSTRTLCICEGIMDTLSAFELKKQAVGLIGVSTKIKLEEIKLLRGKDVSIMFDWDEAGEAGAKKLKSDLMQYGVRSNRITRPSSTSHDLNEYLMEKCGLI